MDHKFTWTSHIQKNETSTCDRVCLGWDSVRRAVDMVEGRVELVGVELAREWRCVGWRQGRYGGYRVGSLG